MRSLALIGTGDENWSTLNWGDFAHKNRLTVGVETFFFWSLPKFVRKTDQMWPKTFYFYLSEDFFFGLHRMPRTKNRSNSKLRSFQFGIYVQNSAPHCKFLATRLITNWTFKRFFSSVNPHVTFQTPRFWKRSITNRTWKRFLFGVNPHVTF